MKLAFAIATVTALRQAPISSADCEFGSNYTSFFNTSDLCSFEVGVGFITNFTESNTTSTGDTNVTTTTARDDNMAIWKIGDKDSTVQCYSDVSVEGVDTIYPNGSTFQVVTGDFAFGVDSTDTVADGVPLSIPGLYYFQGGRLEGWINNDGSGNATKAEGDITDLCEVLGGGGGGGGAAPAPTPTPPTTEAPSSGQMAAATIIPCVAAAILNYFMFM